MLVCDLFQYILEEKSSTLLMLDHYSENHGEDEVICMTDIGSLFQNIVEEVIHTADLGSWSVS